MTAIAFDEAIRLFVGIIANKERQKWVTACLEFGAEDEGSTANKIMKKGLA